MKTFLCVFVTLIFVGCSGMPGVFNSLDDVLTDEAATATVYKGALQKDTDIHVTIDVINKDQPAK